MDADIANNRIRIRIFTSKKDYKTFDVYLKCHTFHEIKYERNYGTNTLARGVWCIVSFVGALGHVPLVRGRCVIKIVW